MKHVPSTGNAICYTTKGGVALFPPIIDSSSGSTRATFQEMTYVITQPCISVKDASCVDVCPVDCIHPTQSEASFETADQLYINPDECIDCGACEPACPVTAIFEESAVPEDWQQFIKINADFFKEA